MVQAQKTFWDVLRATRNVHVPSRGRGISTADAHVPTRGHRTLTGDVHVSSRGARIPTVDLRVPSAGRGNFSIRVHVRTRNGQVQGAWEHLPSRGQQTLTEGDGELICYCAGAGSGQAGCRVGRAGGKATQPRWGLVLLWLQTQGSACLATAGLEDTIPLGLQNRRLVRCSARWQPGVEFPKGIRLNP